MKTKKLSLSLTLCIASIIAFSSILLGIKAIAETGGAEDNSAPVLLVEGTSLNAYSKEITVPACHVYDSVDVGLTPVVTVSKGGRDYPVLDGVFTADGLGDYDVTYSAINSRGNSAEKTVTLTLTDTNAPVVKTYGAELTCFIGKKHYIPAMEIFDFENVVVKGQFEQNDDVQVIGEEGFIPTTRGNGVLRVTVTEDKTDGLVTEIVYVVSVINKGAIYGFNDVGEAGEIWWGKAQAGNGTSDPELFQVPVVSQNTDEAFVHDGDGKSFKIEVEGREGMSNSNSWPAIYTSEIDFYQAKSNDYLVVWVYNAGASSLKVNMQINGSNSYNAAAVAEVGQWTKISFALDDFNGKSGSKTINSIKFWISGFEDGRAVYYLDDLYFE